MRRLSSLSLFVIVVLVAAGASVPASHATAPSVPRLVVFEAFMRST